MLVEYHESITFSVTVKASAPRVRQCVRTLHASSSLIFIIRYEVSISVPILSLCKLKSGELNSPAGTEFLGRKSDE